MAHKKGEGSTSNGRDSHSQRLGVKIYGGELAIPGNIIIRQRGTNFHPGNGVGMGKDHTIYAMANGIVEFRRKRNDRCYVNVLPVQSEPVEAKETSPKKKAAVEAPVETATADEAEDKPRKRKKAEPESEN